MTYPNNSSTGGYLLPEKQAPTFGDLNFEQFLQTVFVGVSGLSGDLVRPKWQMDPPKQPDITVNWLAIGLLEDDSDTNAFVGIQPDGSTLLMRMEALTVQCSFYGPNSYDRCKILRDGFQIGQNLEALQRVNMGFVNTDRMVRAPDIINERWVDRWEMNVHLRREILRTYPILTFLSGEGTVVENYQDSRTKTVPISITEEEG